METKLGAKAQADNAAICSILTHYNIKESILPAQIFCFKASSLSNIDEIWHREIFEYLPLFQFGDFV